MDILTEERNDTEFTAYLRVFVRIPPLAAGCWLLAGGVMAAIKITRRHSSLVRLSSRAANDPSGFTITEKAPTRAFSWLKVGWLA